MKILHATEIENGGTATVMNLLMLDQIRDQDVKSCQCVAPEAIVDALDDVLVKHTVTFKRSGRNIASLFQFAIALMKTVWREKPDIVHLHSTFAGIIGRCVLVLMKPVRRPKIIYCPHGFSFLMEGSALKRSIFSKIEILLSLMTDKIICVSQYEKNSAVSAGISGDKITVIYNGTPAPSDTYNHTASPYPASDAATINYIFAGRLDKAKGFDILLSAMQKIENKNIHLTVAGINADEVPKSEHLNNITYLGWLSSKHLKPYFIHADALVLPSRWEGFPMVVLEAMSMGIPVVASDCTSLSEAVKHNVTGILFSASNSNELSDAISSTPIASLREMGQNGRERFNEHFTSQRMTYLTSDLYSTLTTKNSNNTTRDIT